jgi:hypothetical protein
VILREHPPGCIEMGMVAQTGKNILHAPALWRRVERGIGGDERDPFPLGQVLQGLVKEILPAYLVPLDFDEEP